ncbi:MAG: twin-arginine translocase subunit TatC [Ferruginibacter sp.]|nr:twin-arginine translocase subunit TatC [Ferruginibacter sp.]
MARDDNEMSFVDHLEALRWHIVRAVVVWLIAAIGVFIYIDWIFDNIIYAPARSSFISYRALCDFSHWAGLDDALCMPPVDIKLLGTTISGPFMSAISISFIGGVIIAFPYLLWELWRFIKPALNTKEVSYSRGAIFWISLFFFAGAAFGYYLLAPFTFNFLANFSLGKSGAYQYIPTLDDYISTITNIILGCGLVFELPVISYVLAKIGILTGTFLKKTRRYSFIIILVLAAVITPSPDWTSQALVAVPLLLLFELSVLLASRIEKQKKKEENTEWS